MKHIFIYFPEILSWTAKIVFFFHVECTGEIRILVGFLYGKIRPLFGKIRPLYGVRILYVQSTYNVRIPENTIFSTKYMIKPMKVFTQEKSLPKKT